MVLGQGFRKLPIDRVITAFVHNILHPALQLPPQQLVPTQLHYLVQPVIRFAASAEVTTLPAAQAMTLLKLAEQLAVL